LRVLFLLPLWEKVVLAKRGPDEGSLSAESTPHPVAEKRHFSTVRELMSGWLRRGSVCGNVRYRTRKSMKGDDMDEFVARANIAHFKTLLESETDQAKRKLLLQLLAEEELKLAAALRGKQKKGDG
jgi:hypothetical protein